MHAPRPSLLRADSLPASSRTSRIRRTPAHRSRVPLSSGLTVSPHIPHPTHPRPPLPRAPLLTADSLPASSALPAAKEGSMLPA